MSRKMDALWARVRRGLMGLLPYSNSRDRRCDELTELIRAAVRAEVAEELDSLRRSMRAGYPGYD